LTSDDRVPNCCCSPVTSLPPNFFVYLDNPGSQCFGHNFLTSIWANLTNAKPLRDRQLGLLPISDQIGRSLAFCGNFWKRRK
jgi:hypothetical protein